MTDFICRWVLSLPLPVLRTMWYPFVYLVDRPLTKLIGPTKFKNEFTNEVPCRWFVEVVAAMQHRFYEEDLTNDDDNFETPEPEEA